MTIVRTVLNLLDTATSIVQQTAWKRFVLTKSCLNCRVIEAANSYLNRVINYLN